MPDVVVRFDGYRVSVYRGEVLQRSWDAVSGAVGWQAPNLQTIGDRGPIPEGSYSFSVDSVQNLPATLSGAAFLGAFGAGTWPGLSYSYGLQRAWLSPDSSTATYGRSNFAIHGSDVYGSRGCIDLVTCPPECIHSNGESSALMADG
jgi:hypothetical protein